jgi:hypothetical protein
LYFSGRREHQRLRRDALVDSYVIYLAASFRTPTRSVQAARLKPSIDSVAQLAEARKQAHVQHGVLMDTLTRLRILAPPAVVSAAEDLHRIDHEVLEFALGDTNFDDEGQWASLRSERNRIREQLVREMRGSLGLTGNSPIRYMPTASSSWLTDGPERAPSAGEQGYASSP